ncbi:hypothetical protein [Spirosoma pomorum]
MIITENVTQSTLVMHRWEGDEHLLCLMNFSPKIDAGINDWIPLPPTGVVRVQALRTTQLGRTPLRCNRTR